MNRPDIWRSRWHAALAIQRRDLRASLYNFGTYITASVAIAVATAILQHEVRSVQDRGLCVLANPFVIPFSSAAILTSIYLAVVSATGIARERDGGMLKTLLYGPVDIVAYLLGKYLAQMSVYVLMATAYLVALWLYALVTNFALDLTLLGIAILAVAITSAVVGIGVLVSTLCRRVWSVSFTLVAVVLACLGTQLGHGYVPGLTKRLAEVSVLASRRQGIGYQVVPQEGWTRPERADDPADVIYAREGTVLYLQPYVKEGHKDLDDWQPEAPQNEAGHQARWAWAHVRPLEEAGNLILDYGRQTVEVLARPYWVEQLPGSVLRYRVVDYDPVAETRRPDLVAYQLFVDANHAGYRLQLRDADGKVVPGSQRRVRRVPEVNTWALYSLAGLPLTIGAFVAINRRTSPLGKE